MVARYCSIVLQLLLPIASCAVALGYFVIAVVIAVVVVIAFVAGATLGA